MSAKHECAAEGCARMVDNDKLMCLAHWRQVPIDVQREVWRTWRAVHRDRQAYVDAKEKAIAAVARANDVGQGSMF